MVPIRIELTRSGGVAGISRHASVDTVTLPLDEAHELAALVGQIDFAGLARLPEQPPRGPDRFQYDLTVEQGSTRYQLSLPETAVPAELKSLLDRIIARAKGG
jgi:Emfourin